VRAFLADCGALLSLSPPTIGATVSDLVRCQPDQRPRGLWRGSSANGLRRIASANSHASLLALRLRALIFELAAGLESAARAKKLPAFVHLACNTRAVRFRERGGVPRLGIKSGCIGTKTLGAGFEPPHEGQSTDRPEHRSKP
jgi:hypothetical protein